MKLLHTVYKTTNNINQRYYVGIHSTTNPYDDYMGSGIFIKKALRKYGKSNFTKEVLFIFEDKQDMINKEKEIVNVDLISDPKSYNMSKGGFGLNTLDKDKKILAINKMKNTKSLKSCEEINTIIQKREQTMINRYGKDVFKRIGKKSSNKQKENYKNGYINPRTNFTTTHIYNEKDEIMFTFPFNELKEICKLNNLPERVLIKSRHQNGTPLYTRTSPRKLEYSKFKGWYCLSENQTRFTDSL